MKKLICRKYPSSKRNYIKTNATSLRNYIRSSEDYDFELPDEFGLDCDGYLGYFSERVLSDFGFDPELTLVSYQEESGDEEEFTYRIDFKDKFGTMFKGYLISFINTGDEDDPYWVWDNEVYDRSDWLREDYEAFIKEAKYSK